MYRSTFRYYVRTRPTAFPVTGFSYLQLDDWPPASNPDGKVEAWGVVEQWNSYYAIRYA